MEEDLRRRLDYNRGALISLPPHLLDEHYRRHLLNGSHEHGAASGGGGFKEPPHGQVYLPPHFYPGRDYPVPVDPYLSRVMSGQSEIMHRYAPPVSPRIMEPFRRGEHHIPMERMRSEFEAERRYEEKHRHHKERVLRSPPTDMLKKKHMQEGTGKALHLPSLKFLFFDQWNRTKSFFSVVPDTPSRTAL